MSERPRAGGALARDPAPQHRLADPVHDRLHVAGQRDLLLPRGDRRPRARAHAARVPARGAAVRAHRDDLRGGRLAAPGARRLDGVRPLRVQRARELRRRLGDPARLRHPDRRHRLLGDPVPARLLESAGQPRARRWGWRWPSSRSSCCSNIRGFGGRRARRVGVLVAGDLALQGFIVVLGLVLFFNPHTLLDPIHLGSAPTWSDLVFALTVTVIAFTSLESAAGLAGEVRISRGGLKRLVASGTATVVFLYVGIALVAVTALPVHDGHTELATRYLNAPMIGIVAQMHPHWLEQTLHVPGGRAGHAHARGGGQLGDARPLAAGVLALHQSPDPERPGTPASAALDPVRADHPRGRDRGGAGRAREPRLPRRDLRVRGDARLHDRPPVDLPAALLRARPRPPLQGAAVDHAARRRAAAAGGLRGAGLRRRLGGGDGRARTGSLRRARVDGGRDRAVCGLPPRG